MARAELKLRRLFRKKMLGRKAVLFTYNIFCVG